MGGCLNEISLIGNLARDPESRVTQAGKKIVNLVVATSESWKDASGDKKERVEFHRCVIFNEGLGGVADKYLKKGSKVFLRGSLQTRKWTDQQGIERFSTEVVLQSFNSTLVLLDSAKGGDRAEQPAAPKQTLTSSASAAVIEDEIPF